MSIKFQQSKINEPYIAKRRHAMVSASLMMVDAVVSAVAILLILIILLTTRDQSIARTAQADLIYRCEADGKTLISLLGPVGDRVLISDFVTHLKNVSDPAKVAVFVRLETTIDTFVQCGLRSKEIIRQTNVRREADGGAIYFLDIAYLPFVLDAGNE